MGLTYKKVSLNDTKFVENLILKSCFPHKENLIKIKIPKLIDFEIIIKDNIRIGIINKKDSISFINPFSFSHKLITRRELIDLGFNGVGENYIKQKNIYIEQCEKRYFNYLNDLIPSKIREKNNKDIVDSDNPYILILGPNNRNIEIKKFLEKNNYICEIKDSKIKDNNDLDRKYTLIISSGYAYKIPEAVVNLYHDRIINLHATFLPWGKGIGTTLFAFLLNQPTGVSIHFIDKEIDTGDLLFRKKITAKANDSTRTFYMNLIEQLNELFIKSWPKLVEKKYKRIRQNYYKILPPYFSRIDFENLVDFLPSGYDTKVFDLSVYGEIESENRKCLNHIILLMKE